jgi:hypothetical protein
MKKYLFIIAVLAGMTSCLKSGLDELPAFDEADITGVFFEYRYIYTRPDGGMEVKNQTLTNSASNINKEQATVTVTVNVPEANSTFTESERNKVSINSLIARMDLSTAAKVEPVEGAPALGSPGNFASSAKYKVTSADGKTSKTWTLSVTLVK